MDSDLLFFFGESCPYTKIVAPAIECVELSLQSSGQKGISRLEVYSNQENSMKYIEVGGRQKCGGVPFFYNARTGESVCGAATCERLKLWAQTK